MKCPDCNREYNGSCCPYCNDDYQKPKPKVVVSKSSLLMSIVALVLAFISMSSPVFLILSIISLVISIVMARLEKNKGKLIFINLITIVILVISLLTFFTPYYEKNFGYKNIEKTLMVDLPNKKADEYRYENKHDSSVKYIYYKYELSEEEYQKILESDNINEYDDNMWFINNVSDITGNYIIYNKMKKSFTTPEKIGNCRYMLLQIENNGTNYYAYVYDVAVIRKGN